MATEVLSPSEFAETTVCQMQLDPKGPYPDGLRTFAVYEDHVLIEEKRVGLSAARLLMKARAGSLDWIVRLCESR